jgi:capsular polysaccharide biosynthesis protein
MGTPQDAEIEISTLYPEQVLRRRLPVNLKPEHLQLFGRDLEKLIPVSELLVIHNVFASSEGLLFKSGRILRQSFAAPFLLDAWKTRSRLKFLANNYLLKASRTLTSDAVWIVDDWSSGYYHWLADTIPRLFSVRERMDEATLLLPNRFRPLEFVTSSLKPFGLRNIEFIGDHERVLCPRLIVPMHTAPTGSHNEKIVRGIRPLFAEFYADSASEKAERIYISRQKASKRRIVNEGDVVEIMSEFDFRIVHAEDMSFAEQVQAFSAARYLVSIHGAGLTNMMFMQPGGSVLELRHQTDRSYNCYFNLTSALDLKYFYQTCPPDNPSEDAHSADILIDVGVLRETLEVMLGNE